MHGISKDLIDLLDNEREILLSGELEKLEDISISKQMLREKLEGNINHLTETELSKIKDRCVLNDRLLKASLDGLGAVKARLAAISDVQNQLTTYGGNGKINRDTTNANSVERRA